MCVIYKLMINFGDPKGGWPGMRMQTFCEETFEFKVLVDAFATYQYIEIPDSPVLKIVPGPAVKWKVQVPTMRKKEEPFNIRIISEDRWGNPTNKLETNFKINSSLPINGLPKEINSRSQKNGVLLILLSR